MVKNLPANAGDVRDANSLGPNDLLEKEMATDSIQYYYCLGNPMDREAWWVTIHGVTCD